MRSWELEVECMKSWGEIASVRFFSVDFSIYLREICDQFSL